MFDSLKQQKQHDKQQLTVSLEDFSRLQPLLLYIEDTCEVKFFVDSAWTCIVFRFVKLSAEQITHFRRCDYYSTMIYYYFV
jgi:hypothetical protein